jgi:RecA-family ATPase
MEDFNITSIDEEIKKVEEQTSITGKTMKNSSKKANIEKVVYNAVELMELGNLEPKYLISPIFPQQGTAVLAGKPDTGKSQFARQLCIQIALGEKSFLDLELNTIHNRSIYVATEDSRDATTYLLSKQLKGLNREAVENLRFIFADTLEQKEIIKKLDKALTKTPVDLVVIDSYGDIFTGNDTNNNMAMRNTVKCFGKIAKKHNCLILFVHHINKGAYKIAPGQENIQGGAGLLQKVRLAIQLSEGEDNIRYFSVVKGNYCPKKFKQNSFILNFSEEKFLFTNSGETIPTDEIGKHKSNSSKEENQDDLKDLAITIFSDNLLSYSEFVNRYCGLTKKSAPTAKRVIKKLKEQNIIENIEDKYRLK